MKQLFSTVIGSLLFLALPSTVSAQAVINPVAWKTDSGQFSSGNFYIRIKDKFFYAPEPVRVSMPAGGNHATIELTWQEYGQEMRMYMYFKTIPSGMWEMYELRTYNYEGRDWIYYSPKDSLGNPIKSLLGHRDFASDRIFKPLDSTVDAEIYCKDCSITTFSSNLVPISVYGYGVNLSTGLPSSETITVSTDPTSGYGVNAQLLDSQHVLVKDQSDFTYDWRTSNSNIATIYTQSVEFTDGKCAYDVSPPCPKMNVQISGKSPGIVQIMLDVVRVSDSTTIASGNFDVKVIDSQAPKPSSTPRQVINDTKNEEDIKNLQLEIGRINKTVEAQKQEIGFLKKLVLGLQSFLNRFFRFGKN